MTPTARRRCAIAAFVLAAGLSPAGAASLPIDLPGAAELTGMRHEAFGSYLLPLGPYRDGAVPARRVEGAVDQLAWRIEGREGTTLDILAALRAQLLADGFAVLFECDTVDCGGFDFRFATDVLPEPDMHVDLGDFRFLSAERTGPEGPEAVSLLVSRSQAAGFVQMVRVGGVALPAPAPQPGVGEAAPPPEVAPPAVVPVPTIPPPAGAGDLASRLETGGAVALDDLAFASGASVLADGDYASLAALADYLAANPARAVAIVGHTDASGSLASNIALSRARAQSVRDVLIDRYGVSAAQVQADGVGYLAPRATNLTDEGRRMNRRVEVMLTSTQ